MTNKICVYAICKNEMKFIDKWLESMSEADYIVVLDTGSTDGTLEKLKSDKRITRVEQKIFKPWRFDKARNESMKLVPDDANILVCTDFDELFTKGWAKIVRDCWTETTTRMYYPYAWSHNDAGEPTMIFTYDKIHNRDFHWIYPVHEVLDVIEGVTEIRGVETKDFMLEHFPDITKSRTSYFDLLKLGVSENPGDPHIGYLYAREFANNERWEEALKEYDRTLHCSEIDIPRFKREKLGSIHNIAKIYLNKQDYINCVKYATLLIQEDPTYLDPYLLLANIYIKQQNYNMALGCITDGQKRTYQHFDWVEDADTYTGTVEDILSVIYYFLGDLDKAISYGEEAIKHNPNNTRIKTNMLTYYGERDLKKFQESQKK